MTNLRHVAHSGEREQAVGEDAHETASHDLKHPIGEESPQRAWRELARSELQRCDGEGEDERRDGDKGSGDGGQDTARGRRTAAEEQWHRDVADSAVKTIVHLDAEDGQRRSDQRDEAGDKPEAVDQIVPLFRDTFASQSYTSRSRSFSHMFIFTHAVMCSRCTSWVTSRYTQQHPAAPTARVSP